MTDFTSLTPTFFSHTTNEKKEPTTCKWQLPKAPKQIIILLVLLGTTLSLQAKDLDSLQKPTFDIGFYLGGSRLGSELYASNTDVLQPRALYRNKTEPSAGIFLRYNTLNWFALETSGSYSSLVGIGNAQEYSFKLNSFEFCLGAVFDFVALLKSEQSRIQINGKIGYGWTKMSASSGELLKNNIPDNTIVPIGVEFAFAVDQKRNRNMIIGYDYRFTNYNNSTPLEGENRAFEMGGYGIFKVGFSFKLGKNACPGGSCAWTN